MDRTNHPHSWSRIAVVLVCFSIVFCFLTVWSYTQESATWDEPYHLTAGYTALKLGDYRIDPEHPPFLRMWAAIPLLFMDNNELKSFQDPWQKQHQWEFARAFVYRDNDADSMLYRARFMIVLLGVLLGVMVFSWAHELFGFWTALIVLALYTVEPNILAHARLVTTDFGITCFLFGTVYFLWRTCRHLTLFNVTGMTLFFSLAHISKFSAILLGPIVVLCFAGRVVFTDGWTVRIGVWYRALATRMQRLAAAVLLCLLLGITCYWAIWAVYRFRYQPSPSPSVFKFESNPEGKRMPAMARVATWVDQHQLLPNTYVQGFILGQTMSTSRSAYLCGKHYTTGLWRYFPVAFSIKTPFVVIGLFLAGLALALWNPRQCHDALCCIMAALLVYGTVAMASKINIGLRHILPLYPFVILTTGFALHLLCVKLRPLFVSMVPLVAVIELATVYPHVLTFFNGWAGGPSQGRHYLIDANLDWGQDLKRLKFWMDANKVDYVSLRYWGTADPNYYGIQGSAIDLHKMDQSIRLPGYVAISATYLQGAYAQFWEGELGSAKPDVCSPLRDMKPVAVIGNTILVYWIDRPWW